MFGIGMPEFIIILVVALLVIGPQKFPGMLRSLGRGLGELKRATNEIRDSVQSEMDKVAEETELKDIKETLANDFGGVATNLHQTGPFGMNDVQKLDALANAFEKTNESTSEKSNPASDSSEESAPVSDTQADTTIPTIPPDAREDSTTATTTSSDSEEDTTAASDSAPKAP